MNIFFQKYNIIFKTGLALFTIGLIALSQPFLTIINFDYKAKESQFIIEAQENKKINEINCNDLKTNNIAKCNFTKYQLSENETLISIATNITTFCFSVGVLCFILPFIFHFSTNREKHRLITHSKL